MTIRQATFAGLITALFSAAPASAQVIAPNFAGNYSFINLGSATSVPTPYGGVTFKAGDPNTLLIGGAANGSAAAIYQIPVLRGAGNHISAFGGARTRPKTSRLRASGSSRLVSWVTAPVLS